MYMHMCIYIHTYIYIYIYNSIHICIHTHSVHELLTRHAEPEQGSAVGRRIEKSRDPPGVVEFHDVAVA